VKGFSRWGKFFRQRHVDEYIGAPVLGQGDQAFLSRGRRKLGLLMLRLGTGFKFLLGEKI
jgi:hypothetical protein